MVRFYFQLTTIHFLAAQRPAEFSNAFFQNVLQRRRAARDRLQAALDGMIVQDPNKDLATITVPATQNEQPAKKKAP